MANSPTRLSKDISGHERNWAARLFNFKFSSKEQTTKCGAQKTQSQPCTPIKSQSSQFIRESEKLIVTSARPLCGHPHRVLLSSPISLSAILTPPRTRHQQENETRIHTGCNSPLIKMWPLSISLGQNEVGLTSHNLSTTTTSSSTATSDQQICSCMSAPTTPALRRQLIHEELKCVEEESCNVVTRHLPRYRRRFKCSSELHYTLRRRHSSLPDKGVLKQIEETPLSTQVKPRTRLLRSSVPSAERLQSLRQSFAPKLKEMQEIGPQRYLAKDDEPDDENVDRAAEQVTVQLSNVKLKSAVT